MIDKKEYELHQFALHFNTVTVQAKFDRKIYFISQKKNVLFPGITTFFGIEKYCTIYYNKEKILMISILSYTEEKRE